MSRKVTTLAIIFADISGTTRLYESSGNEVALELVTECLELMAAQVERHGGTVTKTIGEEIMCSFSSTESAVQASMAIQEHVTADLPSRNAEAGRLAIRIGLNYGPAILEGGDVFGDAVNIAARMAGLAKGGQIITTLQTVETLPALLRAKTRHLDQVPIKGKSEVIDIFEVIWEAEDVTRIAPALSSADHKNARLRLSYDGRIVELDQNMTRIVLGRDERADLRINASTASREHAHIEYRRGQFVLTDRSTNGTYVLTCGDLVYLRRESVELKGTGRMALGQPLDEATQIVTFECE